MNYFITAIGTGSGKTIVSAIFSEALQADYWKPIQAGRPTDTETVKSLISNEKTFLHSEAFLLNTPSSPHASAKIDNVDIHIKSIDLPNTSNNLVIEGAGGLMVPVNDHEFVIDFASQYECEIILVCDLYLGSINHSLLSINYLKLNGYNLKGIVFNGLPNQESERIILNYAEVPCLLRLMPETKMDKECISDYAETLKRNLVDE
jgi:dethiobiotin synthetase